MYGTEAPLVCILGAQVGSLVSFRSETPLPVTLGPGSLWLNPSALVCSKHRGQFWPMQVVHPAAWPSPASVYEAQLFPPCLLEERAEQSVATPDFDKAFTFPSFPLAAPSICCVFNSEEARVELRL